MNNTVYFRTMAANGETKTFEEIEADTGLNASKTKCKARWFQKNEGFQLTITENGLAWGDPSEVSVNSAEIVTKNKPQFNINTRFEFLEKLTKMVVLGVQPALFITGDGGLGKTHTVMKIVKECNADPLVIKGFSTSAGLYRTLHDNRNSLVIFDDCDSVFQDKIAANILKAATDSSDERIVSYNAQIKDYEQSFEFTGQIIFISNLRTSQFPQALISRSTVANMDMTENEKIERIETVLPYIEAGCDLEVKEYTLQFMKKNTDRIADLNFRTLIKLAKIFNIEGCTLEAEDLALFVVCH